MKNRNTLLKRIPALLLAAMMAASFTACNGASGSGSASETTAAGTTAAETTAEAKVEEPASLVLWGSEDDQTMLKEMAAEFTAEHKTYTVEVRVQGEDKAKDAVLKDLDATADVFGVAHDALGALVEAGAIYPNTNYVDEIKSNDSAAALTAATYNGEVYGYPSSTDTYFMYYNKSVFSEDDVKSLDKMLEVATKKGKNVGCDMGNNYFTAAFWFANGCKLFGDTGADVEGSTFNGAEGLAVAQYLSTIKAKGAQDITDGDASSAFQSGTLAAQITGNWKAKDYKDALGENYGVAKLPTIKVGGADKQMVSFSGVKLYVVKSNTKFPEAAMQLASFLTSEKMQLKRFTDRALLPVNKKVAADPAVMADPTVAAQIEQTAFSIPMPSVPQMTNFWSTSSMAVSKEIFNGTAKDFQATIDNWATLLKAAITQ